MAIHKQEEIDFHAFSKYVNFRNFNVTHQEPEKLVLFLKRG